MREATSISKDVEQDPGICAMGFNLFVFESDMGSFPGGELRGCGNSVYEIVLPLGMEDKRRIVGPV